MVDLIADVTALIAASVPYLTHLVVSYGYLAVFALMALEGSSFPVPSEVVLPLFGAFAQQGLMIIR